MRLRVYTWDMFDEDVAALKTILNECRGPEVHKIYGEPRGGLIPAVALSHALNLPLTPVMDHHTLWVDDIADSGKALSNAVVGYGILYCVLVRRASCPIPVMAARVEESSDWLVFPWEDYAKAEADCKQYMLEHA